MHERSILQAMLDQVQDVVLVVQGDRIIAASQSAESHLGYSPDQLLEIDATCLLSSTSIDIDHPSAWSSSVTRLIRRDGTAWECQLRLQTIADQQLVLIASDISGTDLDPLTRVGNRVQIENRLVELQKLPESQVACFFIDLDHFKQVNDRWGHAVGDEVLRVVASRIRRCFRPHDAVARYGGDEFVALVSRCPVRHAEKIGDRILHTLDTPVDCKGMKFDLSASIGIACGPPHADLVERADQAMYLAKAAGRQQLLVAGH